MKSSIRKAQLRQRRELDTATVAADSAAILAHLLQLDAIITATRVHLYYPINNEVDTTALITHLWARKVEVQMPRTDFENHRIVHYCITSFNQLEETSFSMHEPKVGSPLATAEPDVVIVPGVCFDLQGNRMGYGGGFYDRFLQQTAAIKIAPAYSFQVLNTIPTETHDITMDIIITPQGMVHP